MVSPFMAFARGALEGYNEMQAEKRAYENEQAKERIKNEGKTKVKEPLRFTVQGSNGLIKSYFELGIGGERIERDDYNFHSFLKDPELLKDIAWAKDSDPIFYNNARGHMADLSQKYVQNNVLYNDKEGKYLSITPEFNMAHKSHPFSEIFVNIANGMAPNTNQDSIIKNYTDNKGKQFWETNTFSPEEYGLPTKRDLYTAAYDLKRNKKDSARDLNYYVTTIDGEMWKGYSKTGDILSTMRAKHGRLDPTDVQELRDRLQSDRYFKDMDAAIPNADGVLDANSVINAPFNTDRMYELITMGSSVNHTSTQNAFRSWTITRKEDLADELGIGETSVFGERARAARDSLDTIKRLQILYEEGGEQAVMGRFLGGATTLFQSVFGFGGTIDQLGDLINNFDSSYGTKAEAGLIEKMKKRMSLAGKAENYSRRQVLMELLAYQIAAAIQGGTGGRTISDTDVKRISGALGNTIFANKDINMARLSELGNVMDNISKVSIYYGQSTDVESLKGAHALAMFSYGVGLNNMGSDWLNGRVSGMGKLNHPNYVPTNAEIDARNPDTYNAPSSMSIIIPGEEGGQTSFSITMGENLLESKAYQSLTEQQKVQAQRQFKINSQR